LASEAVSGAARAAPPPRRALDSVIVWFVGRAHFRRFTVMHSLHSAAETCFAVSMAGSIFFSVSAEAARPRVLLFLGVTLAPFLVMAPLVGPVIDRVRGGIGNVVVGTFAVRAVLVLLLAQQLRTLALFPLAFGVLVVAKTYTVARNALVPRFVDSDEDLVAANARLSRTASIVGAIAGVGAVALFATAGGPWTLRLAAVFYLAGAVVAWTVRRVLPATEASTQSDVVPMVRIDLTGATWDMMVLRAAVGYAVFHFAFSLRAGNDPVWVLGAVVAASSIGGFVGTIVAPAIRARTDEDHMFTLALLGAAGAMLAASAAYARATLIIAMLILGLAASLGRRALDSTIQQFAPPAQRGRIYASLETRLELAWVSGACLAVASRLSTVTGVLALAFFLVVMAAHHVRRHHLIELLEPPPSTPLPDRLINRAETLAGLDHHDEAIVVALSAAQLAGATDHDPELRRARELLDRPADADELRDTAARVIARVRTLVHGTVP
jgi:hypothetical protein